MAVMTSIHTHTHTHTLSSIGKELLKFRTDDGSDTAFAKDIDSAVDDEGFKMNKKLGYKCVSNCWQQPSDTVTDFAV